MRKEAAKARAQAASILTEASVKAAKLELYAKALDEAADAQEGLRARHGYGTVRGMDATPSVTAAKRPGPQANDGPMAKLAAKLGLTSLRALATFFGLEYDNVRRINARGTIPASVQKTIDRVLAAKAEAAKSGKTD